MVDQYGVEITCENCVYRHFLDKICVKCRYWELKQKIMNENKKKIKIFNFGAEQ